MVDLIHEQIIVIINNKQLKFQNRKLFHFYFFLNVKSENCNGNTHE